LFDIGGFLLSFSVESNLIIDKIDYLLTYRRNTGYLAELFLRRIQEIFKNIFEGRCLRCSTIPNDMNMTAFMKKILTKVITGYCPVL